MPEEKMNPNPIALTVGGTSEAIARVNEMTANSARDLIFIRDVSETDITVISMAVQNKGDFQIGVHPTEAHVLQVVCRSRT